VRPEAVLSRDVLLELGGFAGVWVHPNVVGQGYPAMVRRLIADALGEQLSSIGASAKPPRPRSGQSPKLEPNPKPRPPARPSRH
jgi:hypothetical protein